MATWAAVHGVGELEVIDRPGRVVHETPSAFDVDVGVGQEVLHRLEPADRHAELDASLGVFDGKIESTGHHAHEVGGDRDQRDRTPPFSGVGGQRPDPFTALGRKQPR